jgi:hypothetical protein
MIKYYKPINKTTNLMTNSRSKIIILVKIKIITNKLDKSR